MQWPGRLEAVSLAPAVTNIGLWSFNCMELPEKNQVLHVYWIKEITLSLLTNSKWNLRSHY